MLKREIKYVDFNGNTTSETYYFNLTKSELLDMELDREGGMQAFLQNIVETKDVKGLIKEFKNLIILSFGVKSEDGKRFIKSDELRAAFVQTSAYDALFMELATDDKAAAEFIIGIMPADMREEIMKANTQATGA